MSSENRRNSIFGQFSSSSKYDDSLQVELDHSIFKKRKKNTERILSTLDILISVFIVTPLVVACWRGTWALMDIYSDYFPAWESSLLGTLIHVTISLAQESFNELLNKNKKSFKYKLFSFLCMKIYTIVLNIVTNLQWRGIWILIDDYFGVTYLDSDQVLVENFHGCVIFYGICFLFMFLMRSLRNLNSPPFEICLDYGDDMFLYPNMFKVDSSQNLYLYILDVLFSVTIVSNLGVIVWRGLSLIVELYFFPDDIVKSSWGSIILGYTMVAIVFLSQNLMKKICDHLNGIPKLLVADSYMMFSIVAVIIVWRGISNLLDIYLFPDNFELSCWICFWIPMLILMIMGCSNSVLVRGIYLDCEEPDGNCVVFPCNYLRIIFHNEKYNSWYKICTEFKEINKQIISPITYHIVNLNTPETFLNNNNLNITVI